MIRCPCCQSKVVKKIIYSKSNCPVLSNIVYKTKKEASNCALGNIELVMCCKCGFVFNRDFNERLIIYKRGYDNSRYFSRTYRLYLDKLVSICAKSISKESKILEIGCGNGDFLKKFCSATGARGFGYDNTYKKDGKLVENVDFFKKNFVPSKSKDKFDVLILRHVLEHIPEPYNFLKNIYESRIFSSGAKLWIEVPDFQWILDNGAFYDIAYEHCSYFLKQTLSSLLSSIGFEVSEIINTFDNQYILLEANYSSSGTAKNITFAYDEITSNLRTKFINNKQAYSNLIKNSKNVYIWGAAGKGVTFLSELTNTVLKKVKYIVDINPQKQGMFLPFSAKKILPPETLKEINAEFVVLSMNRIYEEEIRNKLGEMKLNAQIYAM